MPKTWFISHPSGSPQHTPIFFHAIDKFASTQRKVKIVFPHEGEEEVHLTKKAIEEADLIVVEVSIPSTGSGIELGWASAAGKPIIAFHQGGTEVSPAVKYATHQIHIYITEEDIIEKLASLVA